MTGVFFNVPVIQAVEQNSLVYAQQINAIRTANSSVLFFRNGSVKVPIGILFSCTCWKPVVWSFLVSQECPTRTIIIRYNALKQFANSRNERPYFGQSPLLFVSSNCCLSYLSNGSL